MTKVALLGAALAIASAACTLKTTDPADAGSSSSTPDSGTSTQTIGGQCTQIYEVLCAKAINTCGEGGFTLDQCVASNKTACCVDKCDKPAISSENDVTACANAIAAESCNDIVNNAKPRACNNVPRTQ